MWSLLTSANKTSTKILKCNLETETVFTVRANSVWRTKHYILNRLVTMVLENKLTPAEKQALAMWHHCAHN